jgi:hypothetical protein
LIHGTGIPERNESRTGLNFTLFGAIFSWQFMQVSVGGTAANPVLSTVV